MLSIGKLKNIRLNWYCIYCVTFIIIIISSLSFSRHRKSNLPPFVLVWPRLNYFHRSANILLIWKTFSHFSSAMRSFVRQVYYIDRDLIVAHFSKVLAHYLCSVLRTLQSPMGFLRFHRHYHFDNSFTIIYNKSANNYLKWFVSHCLNVSDLLFKVQLFNVHFL